MAGSRTMDSNAAIGNSQGRSPDSANDKGDLSFVTETSVLIGGEVGQDELV